VQRRAKKSGGEVAVGHDLSGAEAEMRTVLVERGAWEGSEIANLNPLSKKHWIGL
jgi:hypothetical protein